MGKYCLSFYIMRKPILSIVILLGFSSLIAQIILIRELVVVFYGNELSLGAIFGNWLFWTAMGSGLLGRFAGKVRGQLRLFALLQLGIAVALPGTILVIRSTRIILHRTLGEIMGFVPMFAISFSSLAPFCLLSGFLFTLGCNLYFSFRKEASVSIGSVYLLESLGASLGGFLASFLLIRFLAPFQIALLISFLNISFAIGITCLPLLKKLSYKLILYFLLALLFIFSASHRLEYLSNKILWRGYNLLYVKNTVYGNIAVTQVGDQVSFFQNGLLMFTTPNLLYSEESVHFALLEHPNPRRLLLIGGGIGGGLKQALLHPSIQRVDYVELDPAVIALGRRYLPRSETRVLKDPRVRIWNLDGRFFVKNTSNKYDVVIVCLPAPYTTQINRFYTVEFFQEVKRILTEEGIFSFGVISSENVIGEELSRFLSCLHASLSQVFPEVVIIPGDTNYFIACNKAGVLTDDPYALVDRLIQRELKTIYVREYYLPYRMSQERRDYLRSRLNLWPTVEPNRDFKPVGYYYDTILWSTYFSPSYRKIFLLASRIGFPGVMALSALLIFIFLPSLFSRRSKGRLLRRGVILSIMVVGFSEISLEVMVTLGFQVLFGYIYSQIALIVTSYMVGLTLGSWLSTRRLSELRNPLKVFKLFQLLMVLFPLFLWTVLLLFSKTQTPIWKDLASYVFFPLLVAVAGFIGGYQFPLANKLYLRSEFEIKRVAGSLYAVDLVGSCMGAIIAGAFLLPILGIPKTCLALTLLNSSALIILMMIRRG